ncbi:hypothetical protein [Aquicella lusitana]|uniref:Uncharacterized protein n=1 Tax=Aquicella lusitana TaxID=254246 RepID=A0A370G8S7_9COXI|nr:hypothetical protein [Aquicella lusitana]RDI40195.1 hypothetical protein C8D86_12331 [Aquicella lusitana]VVC72414.1 hypothetical protein AQULUS_01240 [Aquicella lusitana]
MKTDQSILYIPFKEENDLLEPAKHWAEKLKNRKKYSIIQFGSSEKRFIPGKFSVYILGHGVASPERYPAHIVSHRTSCEAETILSIEEVADRFNQDFLYYLPSILRVKLYFCNTVGNAKQIAELFRDRLLCADPVKIDYYAGTLGAPSHEPYPQKYAFFSNGFFMRASWARRSLLKDIREDDQNQARENVKQRSYSRFLSEAKKRRVKGYWECGDEKRNLLLTHRRTSSS